jgi:hypothetical protein
MASAELDGAAEALLASVTCSQNESTENEVRHPGAFDRAKTAGGAGEAHANHQPSVGRQAVVLPRWGQLGSIGVKARKTGCTPYGCSLDKFNILGQVEQESNLQPAVVEPAAVRCLADRPWAAWLPIKYC